MMNLLEVCLLDEEGLSSGLKPGENERDEIRVLFTTTPADVRGSKLSAT